VTTEMSGQRRNQLYCQGMNFSGHGLQSIRLF
jgi:hypothetical protein